MTIAIIGAGLAGAAAALRLSEAGLAVALFDKGRGVGGRLATREGVFDTRDGATVPVQFDHGAPAVPARGALGTALATLPRGVSAWSGPASPGDTVGVPSMRSLVAGLLGALPVATGVTVDGLTRDGEGWWLHASEAREGPFSAVILTVPAPQAIPLVSAHAPQLVAAAGAARYSPCWTAMAAFDPGDLPDLATLARDALADDGVEAIIHDGGKPGRAGAPTLVLHASAALSAERLEEEREAMAQWFAGLLSRRLHLPAPALMKAHRWRFCRVAEASTLDAPSCASSQLAVAGDWTAGPGADEAFASGIRAADAVLAAR